MAIMTPREIARMLGHTQRPVQEPQPQFSEPDAGASLLAQAGRGTLGLLGIVGNTLDLPGSMIRDILAGENPVDQLLTPFRQDNRTTGRELVRQYGLIGPKDTWGNFIGGVAAEIALDPLTWLTAGLSAAGKASKLSGMTKTLDVASKASDLKSHASQLAKLAAASKPAAGVGAPATFSLRGTGIGERLLEARPGLEGLASRAPRSPYTPLRTVGDIDLPSGGTGWRPPLSLADLKSAPLLSKEARLLPEVAAPMSASEMALQRAGELSKKAKRLEGMGKKEAGSVLTLKDMMLGEAGTVNIAAKNAIQNALGFDNATMAKEILKADGILDQTLRDSAFHFMGMKVGKAGGVITKAVDKAGRYLRDSAVGVKVYHAFGSESASTRLGQKVKAGTRDYLRRHLILPRRQAARVTQQLDEIAKGLHEKLDGKPLEPGHMVVGGGMHDGLIGQVIDISAPGVARVRFNTTNEIAEVVTDTLTRPRDQSIIPRDDFRAVIEGAEGHAKYSDTTGLTVADKHGTSVRDHPGVHWNVASAPARQFRDKLVEDIKVQNGLDFLEREHWGEDIRRFEDLVIPNPVSRAVNPNVTENSVQSAMRRGGQDAYLKDVVGGTKKITDIYRDPRIIKLLKMESVSEKQLFNAIEKYHGKDIFLPPDAVAWARKNNVSAEQLRTQIKAWRKELKTAKGKRKTELKGLTGETVRAKYAQHMKNLGRQLQEEGQLGGVFPNDPMFDHLHARLQGVQNAGFLRHAVRHLAENMTFDAVFDSSQTVNVKHVIESMKGTTAGSGDKGLVARIREALPPESAGKDILNEGRVDKRFAEDLADQWRSINDPRAVAFAAGFNSLLNVWKKLQLGPWPAFAVRNRYSGLWNNVIKNRVTVADEVSTDAFLRTGLHKSALRIPEVVRILKERGLAESEENATRVFQEIMTGVELMPPGPGQGAGVGELHDVIGGRPAALAHGPPGVAASTKVSATDAALRYIGWRRDPRVTRLQAANPLAQEGTLTPHALMTGGEKRFPKTTFGPSVGGDVVNYYVEGMNRISPFTTLMRRGVPAEEAARLVKESQVDYHAINYSPLEQKLGKVFPFYKWTARMLPWTLSEIVENPGGPIAQSLRATIRAKAVGTDGDEYIPERISRSLAISLGEEDKEGNRRWLTALDMPFESALQPFQFDSPTAFAKGILGMARPDVKVAIETGTGTQLYSGRNLDELGGGLTGGKVPRTIENAVQSLLLSRLPSVYRTLTDDRKGAAVKALNLLSGARVSDINMDKERHFKEIREIEKLIARDPVARVHKNVYVPTDKLDQALPQTLYLLDEIRRRKRERRELLKK